MEEAGHPPSKPGSADARGWAAELSSPVATLNAEPRLLGPTVVGERESNLIEAGQDGSIPAGFEEASARRLRQRGHDLGFWLVVMNTRFDANAGLTVRIASNFGATGIAFVGSGSFKRASSLGASSSVPILHFDTPDEAVRWFDAQRIALVCAELTPRSIPIHQARWPEKAALVIGDERDGVPRVLLDAAAAVVEIPMYGLSGSMNLAVSAGILAYEHVRRLGFPALEPVSKGGRRSGWSEPSPSGRPSKNGPAGSGGERSE